MSLETYISEFSKYVISIIMILYSIQCLEALLIKREDRRNGLYARQNILIFAFHFSCYMVILFESKELSYLVFYVFQILILYAVILIYKSVYKTINRLIINNMCMLLSISFVILTRLDYVKAIKQFIIATGSLGLALVIPFFIHNLKHLKNLKWIYAIAGVFLLGLVMILGQTTYGSKISYTIVGISFQPAEFVKILFVFFVASALYESSSFFEVFSTSVIAALHIIIQVVNKDLGSALIFFVVYICMLFIGSGNVIYLILGIFAGGGASYVAFRVFRHVQVRVQAWKDPWSVIDSAGYQITQSLFGISSGGYFGLGLMKGSPGSIPFVSDDFIFSALAEEFGIIFSVCLIFICLCTFLMFISISLKLKDRFYQLIAFGLAITYIFQVFLTIGGGTKFIPLTGVTLPLVSYGGSSLLTTIIMFAIIEGLYIMTAQEEARSHERPHGYEHKERIPHDHKDVQKEKIARHKENKQKRRDKFQNQRSAEERYSHNSHKKKAHKDEYYEDEYYEDEYYADKYYEDDYYDDEYYDEDHADGYEDEYEESRDDLDYSESIYYNEEEYEKDKRRKTNKKE